MSLHGREIAHYRIESLLGRGGMGAVYLARDLALDRPVALKMLADELDADLRARLLREARLSARLQHPGIATFYDAGERDGVAFIAMELVEGMTLRERIRRGPLPLDEAIAVVECLLEALVHAHTSEIIHRDIKPENVILTGPRTAKLLDFGLAKRLPVTVDEQATTLTGLTMAGRVMGTAGYMPPEQIRGEPVDARADIFAAGVVLHEAVTGEPAFPGRNLLEVIANTVSREPAAFPATVPEDLRRIARRAMAKEPDERYDSAAAFLSDLHRLTEGRPTSDLPRSLAVLDFENLSEDPAHDWIGSGFAEALTADLARAEGIAVVDRHRVLGAMKASARGTTDPTDIGRLLAARWAASGTFQVVGERIRLTAYLTEVSTGNVEPACKVDGRIDDLFEMQDAVTTAILDAIGSGSQEARRRSTPEMSAYEAYSRGQRYWNRLEKGSFHRAEELYAEAVRLDPDYARAWSGLAGVHSQFFTFTTDPAELETAGRYARRAIELDPAFAEARVWLAYALMRRGDIAGAVEELDTVLDFDPENHYGHYFQGVIRLGERDHEGALRSLQRAAAYRRGQGSLCWTMLGWTHVELENEAEAVYCLEQARLLSPVEDLFGETFLGECLRRFARAREARAQLEGALKMLERSDHMYRDSVRSICLCSLGRTALDLDDTRAARAAFEQAIAHIRGRDRALGAGHSLVQALAGLGRCGGGGEPLTKGLSLFQTRQGYDFSYLPSLSDDVTLLELSRACLAAGLPERARELLERSGREGSAEARRAAPDADD